MKYFALILCGLFAFKFSYSQNDAAKPGQRAGVSNVNKDSLALGFIHRDDRKDSINLTYRFLDSIRSIPFDQSINDFDKYFSIPSTFQNTGNNGAAAYSLIYAPYTKPGWDAGFHAFDVYRYKLEDTKFYKTNRPYTQLSYQLATGKEQMIKAFHTQNPRPNWNFGFNYQLISAPGLFITQNNNHKSYRLFSNYQGKRKRYAAYFVMLGNTIRASQNGGIVNDSSLSDPDSKKRFAVHVNLGDAENFTPNPFVTTIITGNIYKDFTFFVRQTYDLGKRDSVEVNDSTMEYLFYPKLRLQHTFTYNKYDYFYKDEKFDSSSYLFYKNLYNIPFVGTLDTIYKRDQWKVLSNDFSLLQFPDTKNPGQFFLAGAKLENITGQLKSGTKNYYNVILHAEYRNKTRNKLWDVLLKGEYYTVGLNNGDYNAYASIGRYLNKKLGNVRLYFNNVSRTPSFIFNQESNFNLSNTTLSKKENIITFGAEADNSFVNLGFKNTIINNLSYFTDYYHSTQSSKVVNVLQLFASKKIHLYKRWSLYLDAVVQQTDPNGPIKLPLVFTRSRFAYEGTFFKNLNLSTGLEVRYYTPYEAYDYSPLNGQFVPQDTTTIKNLPDVSAFLHFSIKRFSAFIRAENLNTISFSDGFGFTNNNFGAPHYPTPGFIFRFGIRWGFVN